MDGIDKIVESTAKTLYIESMWTAEQTETAYIYYNLCAVYIIIVAASFILALIQIIASNTIHPLYT